MNRLLLILVSGLALVALNSCQTSRELSHYVYYVDYKEAGAGKVFITEANSVSFEYEPLGSILVEETPGSVKETVATTARERAASDGVYGAPESKTVNKYTPATAQSALNYAAARAVELGGDGMINVKLNSNFDRDGHRMVQVTGMVIKRR